ncbi:hypothetical protein Q5424_28595, partial [Conexibacter sp. JD483]
MSPRRGFAALVLLGGALTVAPPAQAADGCANAAFRSGAGARLPDCRAWEQVSPVEKDGNDVVNSGTIASVAGGDRVYFNAAGAFAGAESVLYDTAYLGSRGGDWSTRGTDPGLTPTGLLVKATLGLSEDGTHAVVVTSNALAAGAIEGGSNLYLRDLTQPASYRLIAATATRAMYEDLTGFGGQGNYIGGTADLSAIAFQTTTPLLADAPVGVRSLYLWHDGRLSLASRLPDGSAADMSYDGNSPSRRQHRLSDDGTRLWFRFDRTLYQYVEGEGTTLITRSHRAGDDPARAVQIDGDVVASRDGRTLWFLGLQPLTDDSQLSGIYRWSAGDDSLAAVGGDGAAALIDVSADGRLAWIGARSSLTPDSGGPADFDARLYLLDTQSGEIRYVARFSREIGGVDTYRFSPDGRRVAFVSFSPVTGVDNADAACREPGYPGADGFCGNVFTWDAGRPEEPVRCLSCGPPGMAHAGPSATFGRPVTFFDGRGSRAVTDDGRVWFDSPDRLVPADTNSVGDVYEYTPGSGLSLLTSGTSGEPAGFGDVSEDGRDVFFVTAERLVPQDADVLADLYTARVGGGIAGQQVAPRQAGGGCGGDACRPAPTVVPDSSPVPGSELFALPAQAPLPRLTVARSPTPAGGSCCRCARAPRAPCGRRCR